MVERDVDHFVVGESFLEGVGTVFEVAVGAWEQIGLHPGGVVLHGGDDGGVGFGEVGLGLRVGGIGEGFGDIVWKKLTLPSICSRAISV